MNALSHILAATDFSDCAARTVERAARLAGEQQATLHLVHVMAGQLTPAAAGAGALQPLASPQRLLDSARSRLADQAALLVRRFGMPVQSEWLVGRTHGELARYAAARAIDLSVFGAHGEQFVRDLFVGSTATNHLRKGRQPTLVVRSGPERPYEQVLVAVDFSPAARLAVEAAQRIAPQACIHVLHVSEVPFEGKMRFAGIDEDDISIYRRKAEQQATRALDEFLGGIEGTAGLSRSAIDGRPAHIIMAQARARQADLVVMGKRGQFELDEFLLGSVTLRVLEEIDRDLLLVAPNGD